MFVTIGKRDYEECYWFVNPTEREQKAIERLKVRAAMDSGPGILFFTMLVCCVLAGITVMSLISSALHGENIIWTWPVFALLGAWILPTAVYVVRRRRNYIPLQNFIDNQRAVELSFHWDFLRALLPDMYEAEAYQTLKAIDAITFDAFLQSQGVMEAVNRLSFVDDDPVNCTRLARWLRKQAWSMLPELAQANATAKARRDAERAVEKARAEADRVAGQEKVRQNASIVDDFFAKYGLVEDTV